MLRLVNYVDEPSDFNPGPRRRASSPLKDRRVPFGLVPSFRHESYSHAIDGRLYRPVIIDKKHHAAAQRILALSTLLPVLHDRKTGRKGLDVLHLAGDLTAEGLIAGLEEDGHEDDSGCQCQDD